MCVPVSRMHRSSGRSENPCQEKQSVFLAEARPDWKRIATVTSWRRRGSTFAGHHFGSEALPDEQRTLNLWNRERYPAEPPTSMTGRSRASVRRSACFSSTSIQPIWRAALVLRGECWATSSRELLPVASFKIRVWLNVHPRRGVRCQKQRTRSDLPA